MTVELRPITEADVDDVAAFLHRHLNQRVAAAAWAAAVRTPWPVDAPNHGFQLRDDGAVVGAYLAFYSTRTVAGRAERFCNLGAWCVLESHRFHSVRLLKALLAQDGFHFTDLSPSGGVIALNQRLGFTNLDTTSVLVPNLPWPAIPGGTRVSSDPGTIRAALRGADAALYADHAGTAAARHLLLTRGGRSCYLMFRRDRRRDLPLFASILHVSDTDLLQLSWRAVTSHLLVRHRIPLTLAELRVVRGSPSWSFPLSSARPKMFRSSRLPESAIAYTYSELTCVPW